MTPDIDLWKTDADGTRIFRHRNPSTRDLGRILAYAGAPDALLDLHENGFGDFRIFGHPDADAFVIAHPGMKSGPLHSLEADGLRLLPGGAAWVELDRDDLAEFAIN